MHLKYQVGVLNPIGTKSFQLTEKTTAIDRSRGVRFRSAQELYLTPSRRKVIEL